MSALFYSKEKVYRGKFKIYYKFEITAGVS